MLPYLMSKVQITCVNCGAITLRSPCLVRTGPMFCNRTCRTEHRRKNATALYKEICVNGQRIYEHRYVASQMIGRPLRSDEEVHHIDGDGWNNDPSNLEILDKWTHKQRHPQTTWLPKAKELADKGMSIPEISNTLGLPYRYVWRAFREYRNLPVAKAKSKPSAVDLQEAKNLLEQGLSFRKIARRMGFSHPTISNALRKAGLIE